MSLVGAEGAFLPNHLVEEWERLDQNLGWIWDIRHKSQIFLRAHQGVLLRDHPARNDLRAIVGETFCSSFCACISFRIPGQVPLGTSLQDSLHTYSRSLGV